MATLVCADNQQLMRYTYSASHGLNDSHALSCKIDVGDAGKVIYMSLIPMPFRGNIMATHMDVVTSWQCTGVVVHKSIFMLVKDGDFVLR